MKWACLPHFLPLFWRVYCITDVRVWVSLALEEMRGRAANGTGSSVCLAEPILQESGNSFLLFMPAHSYAFM